MKDYRNDLINSVKAMGQEVIDRAEDIVGECELMTDLVVTLSFPQHELPTLEIKREHVAKRYLDMKGGGER